MQPLARPESPPLGGDYTVNFDRDSAADSLGYQITNLTRFLASFKTIPAGQKVSLSEQFGISLSAGSVATAAESNASH